MMHLKIQTVKSCQLEKVSVKPVSVTPLVFSAKEDISLCNSTSNRRLTDNALPKEVRLPLGGRISGELPVNFVLDTTHGDEGCNYTSPTTGLHWKEVEPIRHQ